MSTDQSRRIDWGVRAATGPTAVSFRLQQPGPATIGRRSSHGLQLNDPAVSRDHARFTFRAAYGGSDPHVGDWLLEDLGSIHGTWLNGVRLKRDRQFHVRPGDLLVIGPWTLLVVDRSRSVKPGTTLATVMDSDMLGTVVGPLEPSAEETISPQGLRLLLQCSEGIHTAHTESGVVEATLDAAIAGTGFTRVAFVRPVTDEHHIEVVAIRGEALETGAIPQLNGALLREAAGGAPTRLLRSMTGVTDVRSEASLETVTALCVPMMAGSTLIGSIYFDHPLPDLPEKTTATNIGAFPLALARLAAMGMANLMRIDIEQRQVRMEAELHAATEAQRWLLPQRRGETGPFTYVGETRPGPYVCGDFFDAIPLGGDRLAVVFGEVVGKGGPVSVVMSASQGYLHAVLQERGDPTLALAGTNRLYCSRISHSRLLKLWVGLFDANEGVLTYAVAGQVRALTISAKGACELLATGDNRPVGVDPEAEYPAQTVALRPGMRTLVVSDGFIGQRAHQPEGEPGTEPASTGDDDQPAPFGITRVQDCLRAVPSGEDEVGALFAALEHHAGTSGFDDDATAVIVRW